MSKRSLVHREGNLLSNMHCRHLLVLCLLVLGAFSQSVMALGLGEITMRSGLGQAMSAEITLISASSAELKSAQVTLADKSVFAESGFDYNELLKSFHFDISKSGASHYVKVSSATIVNEPFLQFIVELKWQGGHMLREFTVLVDPPSQPAAAADKQSAVPQAASAKQQVSPLPVFHPDGAIEYGPTRSNETLSQIAEVVRVDPSHSFDQIMVALQRANPDAFYQQNVNRLKAGNILRIDNPALITALTPQEAKAEIARQTQSWKGELQTTRPAPVIVAQPEPAKLRLSAPQEGDMQALIEAESELHSVGDESLSGESTGEALAGEPQTDGELDASSRLAKLESELVETRNLIAVKDAEIAALTARLNGAPAASSSPASSLLPTPLLLILLALLLGGLLFYKSRQRRLGSVDVDASLDASMQQSSGGPKDEAKASALADKVSAFMNSLFKRKSDIVPIPTIEPISRPIQVQAVKTAAATPPPVFKVEEEPIEQAEESVENGDSISDTSGIQAVVSDVDAMAEADVYIAYGRFRQAEEGLLTAIQATPTRHELKVKLLEAYAAEENVDAFCNFAEEFYAVVNGTGDHWDKVKELATELCPEHALFSDGTVPTDDIVSEDLSALDEDAELIRSLDDSFDPGDASLELDDSIAELDEGFGLIKKQPSDGKEEEYVLEFTLNDEDRASLSKPVVASEPTDKSEKQKATTQSSELEEVDSVSDAALDFDLDFDVVAPVEEGDAEFEFVLDDLPAENEKSGSLGEMLSAAEGVMDDESSVEEFLVQSDEALTFLIEEESDKGASGKK